MGDASIIYIVEIKLVRQAIKQDKTCNLIHGGLAVKYRFLILPQDFNFTFDLILLVAYLLNMLT